jgi:hypothetical protein
MMRVHLHQCPQCKRLTRVASGVLVRHGPGPGGEFQCSGSRTRPVPLTVVKPDGHEDDRTDHE